MPKTEEERVLLGAMPSAKLDGLRKFKSRDPEIEALVDEVDRLRAIVDRQEHMLDDINARLHANDRRNFERETKLRAYEAVETVWPLPEYLKLAKAT